MKLSAETRADLKRSGLSIRDALALHIEERSDYRPSGSKTPVRAYALPYFDLRGEPNGFCRYRLLGEYRGRNDRKPRKYDQEQGTSAHFYLPPYLDWESVARDASVPIYMVEGEKKAAALARLGYPALGIGGLFNVVERWSPHQPADPISDFGLIHWHARRVYLVLDSDVSFRESLRFARDFLRRCLIQVGARPYDVSAGVKMTHLVG